MERNRKTIEIVAWIISLGILTMMANGLISLWGIINENAL